MDWNSNMMQMMRPYSAASDFVEKMQRLRSNSTYLVVVVSLSFFTVSWVLKLIHQSWMLEELMLICHRIYSRMVS